MASAKPSHTALRFSWRTFLFGIVLLGLMFASHYRFHDAFERMDLIAYDLRINTIAPHPSSGLIAIAAVDDRSIAQLGQWPWPRFVLARLVDALKDYKVNVIGFDAIFSEARQERCNARRNRRKAGGTWPQARCDSARFWVLATTRHLPPR